jgi:hypothetical protein
VAAVALWAAVASCTTAAGVRDARPGEHFSLTTMTYRAPSEPDWAVQRIHEDRWDVLVFNHWGPRRHWDVAFSISESVAGDHVPPRDRLLQQVQHIAREILDDDAAVVEDRGERADPRFGPSAVLASVRAVAQTPARAGSVTALAFRCAEKNCLVLLKERGIPGRSEVEVHQLWTDLVAEVGLRWEPGTNGSPP